ADGADGAEGTETPEGARGNAAVVPPGPDAVAAARRQVGYRFLSVRPDPPALRKDRSLYVDLSAIAKGHGVDRLTGLLDRSGCTDYLVDVGGELRVLGSNPGGTAWRIGVETPEAGQWGGVQKVLVLHDRAVATSGDYRNFVEFDQHRFSHTIDPRTGAPVVHGLASVTVIHASAMMADAYATALNVLGPVEALAFAEARALAVYLLIHTQGGFEARYTQPMYEYLVDAQ
ncbi:MAG: FAD:protein FMN transferase, partial [Pseudomonadales bacterium]|nr:FAD:protein FMN transferase [Pseudomonadales bacterium]